MSFSTLLSKKYIKPSACALFVAALSFSNVVLKSAHAGFEFVAPVKQKEMAPMQQDVFAAQPVMPEDFSLAVPPEPVDSEPLARMPTQDNMASVNAPMPIMPDAMPEVAPMPAPTIAPNMNPTISPAMAPMSARATGLIIDPYPLGPHVASDHKSNISPRSIHKAMNEESKVAHPLQLGRNMSTMTKAVRVASTRQDMRQAPSPRTSLVPMPGGIVEPSLPTVKYMDAVGFGRDLPLALALSQVVPPNYAYSFAEDDSAGMTVSWEGGKPWDQVLDDMLSSQGLMATIDEEKKKVIISDNS